MINWDDLRVFIGLTRAGSFSAAAGRLGMDATTVARRIQRLEAGLRATLIVRGGDRLQLTAAGLRLSENGAAFEAAIAAAEEGVTSPLAGTVRISVAEGLGAQILAPAILRLMERPGLHIEIDASPGFLSPTTRKVDLAITSSPPSSARLVVERLTDYELGLTCSSMKMQIAMAAAGAGIGAFPHFLASEVPALRPVLPDLSVTRTYWIATHQELYDVARVRLVRSWLQALVQEHAGRLTPLRTLSDSQLRPQPDRK